MAQTTAPGPRATESGPQAPLLGAASRWPPAAAWGLAAVVLSFIAWRATGTGDAATVATVTDLAFPVVDALAIALGLRAVRHSRLASGEHVAWAMLVASLVAYFVGDALWAVLEISSGAPPGASVADVGYLLFYPLALAGLLSMPGAARTRLEKAQFVIDVLVVLTLGATVDWILVVGPTVGAIAGGPATEALSLAYPIGDLVLLLGVSVVVMRRELSRAELPVVLLVAAVAANLVGDVVSGSQILDDRFSTGGLPDMCFMLFWLLAGLSMFAQGNTGSGTVAHGHRPPAAVAWLPYAAVLGAYALPVAASVAGMQEALSPALVGAGVVGLLIVARQVIGARQAADAASASAALVAQARFDALVQRGSDLIVVVSDDGTVEYCSPSVRRILGQEPGALIGSRLADLAEPDDVERVSSWLRGRSDGRAADTLVWRLGVPGGPPRVMESVGSDVIDGPDVRGVVVTSRDVTERARLEDELNEARRLEAVGRLAGGVAHDFNNLLTGVGGFAELILADLDAGAVKREDVLQIKSAADRAAKITSDLLAFGRRQVVRPEPVDLISAVVDAMPLIEQVAGTGVLVATRFAPPVPPVLLDRNQVVQVLVNLAANARDAMPDGGTLTVQVASGDDEALAEAVEAVSRPAWAELCVSDTGRGMDEATRARLFEPFFTTKGAAHGGGLGLASVYGIVASAGGSIAVESEAGRGALFRIRLPGTEGRSAPGTTAAGAASEGAAGRRVLLVEDEPAIREYARRVLTSAGFEVIAFSDPLEALRFGLGSPSALDVVVTDVVMPGLMGPLLAERLRERRPGLHVLLMSGYPMTGVSDPLLAKPFASDALLEAVRRLLDGTA